ncbi:hypothetical protein ABEV54_18170 [Peribacillus psychrosaccharolyticus]|uniref:hypothetical protein n=1 Tax=Peribacillus psychrosaccharolyticus TaxID=1407 RepID=UPI003D281630
MKGLFLTSLEQQIPVEIIYISSKGTITDRLIIVKGIGENYIRAYCLSKRQPRIFILANILSAAKRKTRRGVNYA